MNELRGPLWWPPFSWETGTYAYINAMNGKSKFQGANSNLYLSHSDLPSWIGPTRYTHIWRVIPSEADRSAFVLRNPANTFDFWLFRAAWVTPVLMSSEPASVRHNLIDTTRGIYIAEIYNYLFSIFLPRVKAIKFYMNLFIVQYR
jgi:hypothetical protein